MFFIKKMFGKSTKDQISDITPKGISKTITSPAHGTASDFNETWSHMYSHIKKTK